MGILSVDRANDYLNEAAKLNFGPWVDHSRYAAAAAASIAKHIDVDPDLARAYGLIHDIGRRFGVSKMRHAIDGYNFMLDEGYPDAARICLTHSFPTFHIEESIGDWDCTEEEYDNVASYLSGRQSDKMDRLIQLCDALALPNGYTIVDRRLIDVTLRYGIDKNTLKRWKGFFKIQIDFEREIGKSIYSLLPGIENILITPIEGILKI